jgi:hypothetical protein
VARTANTRVERILRQEYPVALTVRAGFKKGSEWD